MKDRKLLKEAQEISKFMRLANLDSYSSKVIKEAHHWAEEDEGHYEEDDEGLMEEMEDEEEADEPDLGDEAPEMPDVDLTPEAPAEEGAHSAEDVADAIVKALQGLGLVDVVDEEPEMTGDELPSDEEEGDEDEGDEEDEGMHDEEDEAKMAHLQERVLDRVKKRLMAEKVTENVVRRLKEMAAKHKAAPHTKLPKAAKKPTGHPQRSGKNGLKPAPKAKTRK